MGEAADCKEALIFVKEERKEGTMAGNYDAAMDKLRDEMAENHKDPNLCALGEYMTGLLQRLPEASDRILENGKSLKGAWGALEAYARKLPRSGSCVAVRDEDAYRVCREYYGIGDAEECEKAAETRAVAPVAAAPAAVTPESSLDDLMGW
jgi:hypothetical protein